MNFLAVTCNYRDLVNFPMKDHTPQYLLVEKLLTVTAETGGLSLSGEADNKFIRKFDGLYAVLHFEKHAVEKFDIAHWTNMRKTMEYYRHLLALKGFYIVVDSVLPLSFGQACAVGNYWLKDCIIDVLKPEEYPDDYLRNIGMHFDKVAIRSFDHFEYERCGRKVAAHSHSCEKTIDCNLATRFKAHPKKCLLRLSTKATLFRNTAGGVKYLRRGDVVQAVLCKKPFDVEAGMSWDNAADIYHKLNIFIDCYGFAGVCIEDYTDDMELTSPWSVYSLCRSWEPYKSPPSEDGLILNELAPRRGTRSSNTSGGETTNQEATNNTNHSKPI